jgi:hypothetical protein
MQSLIRQALEAPRLRLLRQKRNRKLSLNRHLKARVNPLPRVLAQAPTRLYCRTLEPPACLQEVLFINRGVFYSRVPSVFLLRGRVLAVLAKRLNDAARCLDSRGVFLLNALKIFACQ